MQAIGIVPTLSQAKSISCKQFAYMQPTYGWQKAFTLVSLYTCSLITLGKSISCRQFHKHKQYIYILTEWKHKFMQTTYSGSKHFRAGNVLKIFAPQPQEDGNNLNDLPVDTIHDRAWWHFPELKHNLQAHNPCSLAQACKTVNIINYCYGYSRTRETRKTEINVVYTTKGDKNRWGEWGGEQKTENQKHINSTLVFSPFDGDEQPSVTDSSERQKKQIMATMYGRIQTQEIHLTL